MNKDPVIAGRHPVLDALQAGVPLDKILLQQGVRGPFEKELRAACRRRRIPLQVVPKQRLARYFAGNHQGVIAIGTAVRYQSVDELLPALYERGVTPKVVLLDGITDVRNFGAIARSAETFGFHAIVKSMTGAPANAIAVKASAGALLRIPVCREKTTASAIRALKENGLEVIAMDARAETPVCAIDWQRPLAVVLGAEGKGIGAAVRKEADLLCAIPQAGTMDSLNVSVAAGIIFYESVRGTCA